DAFSTSKIEKNLWPINTLISLRNPDRPENKTYQDLYNRSSAVMLNYFNRLLYLQLKCILIATDIYFYYSIGNPLQLLDRL
ncbi:MAG: hypothetical protein LC540_20425, partial [Candidatus Thiodiazotropha sp.]|nr:hypothetical protein [Candidatus Thiodiazotropha sp.]